MYLENTKNSLFVYILGLILMMIRCINFIIFGKSGESTEFRNDKKNLKNHIEIIFKMQLN